jgi:hypothetical protein
MGPCRSLFRRHKEDDSDPIYPYQPSRRWHAPPTEYTSDPHQAAASQSSSYYGSPAISSKTLGGEDGEDPSESVLQKFNGLALSEPYGKSTSSSGYYSNLPHGSAGFVRAGPQPYKSIVPKFEASRTSSRQSRLSQDHNAHLGVRPAQAPAWYIPRPVIYETGHPSYLCPTCRHINLDHLFHRSVPAKDAPDESYIGLGSLIEIAKKTDCSLCRIVAGIAHRAAKLPYHFLGYTYFVV